MAACLRVPLRLKLFYFWENFLVEVFVRLRHSVCNLNTKEHKSKSAAITQTGNRVQDLAGVRNETKSSESKFGKAQVSICWVCRSNWWSCIWLLTRVQLCRQAKIIGGTTYNFETIFYGAWLSFSPWWRFPTSVWKRRTDVGEVALADWEIAMMK